MILNNDFTYKANDEEDDSFTITISNLSQMIPLSVTDSTNELMFQLFKYDKALNK